MLAGKVAIVTGAATGVGRAVAYLFAKVVAAYGNRSIKECEADIKRDFPKTEFLAVKIDAAKYEDHLKLVDAAVKTFGAIDDMPVDNLRKVLDVNVIGVFSALKAQIPAMKKCGGGSIIVTASIDSLRGEPFCSSYAASKHAVVGLVKSAALETARANIRVNAVCPGTIDTPMLAGAPEESVQAVMKATPNGRISSPMEQAGLIAFLGSDIARNITGSIIVNDGGVRAQ